MKTSTFLRSAGSLGLASILAACSGAGSATPAASNALVVSQQSMAGGVSIDGRCPKKNGIQVKPCNVKLSVSNPAVDVNVTYPKGDSIADKDPKCTKKNVATVDGADGKYVVTAGTSSGSCSAIFVVKSGKMTVGTGTLNIINSV